MTEISSDQINSKHFLNRIKKKYLLILCCVSAFILLSLIIRWNRKEVYKTRIILTSFLLNTNDYSTKKADEITIKDFESLLNKIMKNYYKDEIILKRFNISLVENLVHNFNLLYNDGKLYLSSDSSRFLKKSYSFQSLQITPSSNQNNSVEVTLSVYNPNDIKPLVNEILSYINNDKYLKLIFESERERLQKLKTDYLSLLNDFEVIKKTMTQDEAGYTFKNEFSLYKEIVLLKSKINQIDFYIKNLNGICIETEPLIPKQPHGLNTLQHLLLFALIGFIIGYFFSVIVDKKNYLS